MLYYLFTSGIKNPNKSITVILLVCREEYIMTHDFCTSVCCVLFDRGVIFCVMCVFLLCLIVVPLPPGESPFAF
jgi:hypothetical protein